MQEIWAVALQAMQSDAGKVDRIASNLANAQTVGFKREVAMQRPYAAATTFEQAMGREIAQAGLPTATGSMAAQETVRDLRPGTLKSTGQSLDVALVGPGYFEVMTNAGPAYTRQGQFALDGRGRLVTAATGQPVMGRGGEIQLTNAQFSVDAAGSITQGGRVVAQLKVVALQGAAGLQALGSGLFATQGKVTMLGDADVNLRQGFVENANVNAMQEMVQLTQTMRHFESMHRVAQSYDDMLGTAIRKLGDL